MAKYISDIKDGWLSVDNYDYAKNGRIWIIWDPNLIHFQLQESSPQFIHGKVSFLQTNVFFLLTAVYAHNSGPSRRVLWQDIRLIASGHSENWIVIGDFNTTRFSDERFGGALTENSRKPNVPRLTQKLKFVKTEIKNWNAQIFGRIDVLAPLYRKELAEIQSKVAADPGNSALKDEERQSIKKFLHTAKLEESLLRQKSRIDWQNLGDSNSHFFHTVINSRRNSNTIQGLANGSGEITAEPDQISNILVSYFKNMLNSQPPDQILSTPEPSRTISAAVAEELTAEFSSEEIEAVINSSKEDKAPGPDGFNGHFFKNLWYLVGTDTIEAIQKFFKSGKLLTEMNATFILLIPKCSGASSPDQYRPISLCNFIYKVITKLLANQLKRSMNLIISPAQSAFIKGRLIQDNILLAHDLCHRFHCKGFKNAMCVKMDLRKAFDNVRHDSLLDFLKKIGFNEKWRNWIRQCISTPCFSVFVNGTPKGYFKSSNGLRQGDPLSPLLFCIIMEMYSVIIEASALQISNPPSFSRGHLRISHLLFADDVLLFSEASLSAVSEINTCLSEFKKSSGLDVNRSKCEVFFAAVPLSLKRRICNSLSITEGSFRAGRIELIKSVLNSFQLFWSAAFNIPLGKYHSIAWETICRPKYEGGLGIRKLGDLNSAAQLKLLWHIVDKRNTPWVQWFYLKYIQNRNFWQMPMPSNPSSVARSILNSREAAKKFICYAVGAGKGINFWTDPWHPNGPIDSQTSVGRIIYNIPRTVTIEDVRLNGTWDTTLISPPYNLGSILHSAIYHLSSVDNTVIWKPESNGKFSMRSAWEQIRQKNEKPCWFRSIWFHGYIPRHCMIAWQALQGKLSTIDRLQFLGSSRDTRCILCNQDQESHDHLFFKCAFSSWIWRNVLWRFKQRRNPANSLRAEEEWMRFTFRGKSQISTAFKIAYSAAIYSIWAERNCRIFNQKSTHKQIVLRNILCVIQNRISYLLLYDLKSDRNEAIAANLRICLIPRPCFQKFCSWIPPSLPFLKLNSDASLSGDYGSIGGLIRNEKGEPYAMYSVNRLPDSINVLELEAIAFGLKSALQLNFQHIWIETDSSIAEKIISGVLCCPWKLLNTLDSIKLSLSSLTSWKISHVWREANRAADFLSKVDCMCKGANIATNLIPSALADIITDDSSGKVYTRL
ncbi:uncharacterized protein LOC143891210 [Tasmannia lanceolata]|uniref:uncharacterized protein LOC143891210 n=1 Tax=Tasmannia lanceolata TaxID=3420 RepID=UPI004062DEAB